MPRVPIEPTPTPVAPSPRLTPPPSQCQCAPLIQSGNRKNRHRYHRHSHLRCRRRDMGIECQLWLAVREMLMRKDRMLLWTCKLLLVFSSPSFLDGPCDDLLCSQINPTHRHLSPPPFKKRPD